LHNKGPGRKKFSGKFVFAPKTAGRLESLYHAIGAWIEDSKTVMVNRPPRLCLLAGNLPLLRAADRRGAADEKRC
jgi:hypothetical protein